MREGPAWLQTTHVIVGGVDCHAHKQEEEGQSERRNMGRKGQVDLLICSCLSQSGEAINEM